MPELVWKTLIPAGVHHAPWLDPKSGKAGTKAFAVPVERLRRWVDKFKALKDQGVHFPVPWGHRLTALPECCDDPDEWQRRVEQRNGEAARFNAGYIEDMRLTPDGRIEFAMHPPPGWEHCPHTNDLINPSDGTRIREVSAGIGNWTDGKRQRHDDIIVHAALCTLPVVAGMGGFATGPSTHLSGAGSVEFTCMLSTRTGGSAMAKKDEDEELDETPEDDGELDYEDPEAEMEPEPAPAPAPMPEPVMPADMDDFKEVTRLLSEMGLMLPPDTDEKNGWKTLRIALTVAQSMGAKFDREPDGDEDDVAPPPASGMSNQDAPQPEPPTVGTMMSTLSIQDPTLKNLALREERRMRKEVESTWDEIKDLGCPVHIADREAARASRLNLSINADTGRIQLPAQLSKARLVKEVLQAKAGLIAPPDEVETTLSTTSPENPAAKSERKRVSAKEPDGDIMGALRSGASGATGVDFRTNGSPSKN